MFYSSAELSGLTWSDAHLTGADVWTSYDERLSVAFLTTQAESVGGNRFYGYGVRPETRDMLLSPVTRLQSSRLQRPLPAPPDALRVYDNGGAELYHLRPLTPYQK
jgi:hypothetical protein